MTVTQARLFIVRWSLGLFTVLTLFFALSPVVGFPLDSEEAMRILRAVVPVFLGYVGAATYYAFRSPGAGGDPNEPRGRLSQLARTLIVAPIFIVAGLVSVITVAFGWSNLRADADIGTGMSIETYEMWLSGALGLLTTSTSVGVAYLFSRPHEALATAPEQRRE